MSSRVLPADLGFLVTLAGRPSLSATARELGLSEAAVSKRLAQIPGHAIPCPDNGCLSNR